MFRATLKTVRATYLAARFDVDGGGLTLHHSPPPIKGRYLILPGDKPPKDQAYHPLPDD